MARMDLLPTFAKLADAKVPTDRKIDGKNIGPVLTGKAKSPHKVFFYHTGNNLQAARSGKWKLHVKEGQPTALYDLETDIGETHDVMEAHPAVVKALLSKIRIFETDLAKNSRPAGFAVHPKPLAK